MGRATERATTRPFENDRDFLRVRALLTETYSITPLDQNWDVRRWDGWRYYRSNPGWDPQWRKRVRLWETRRGHVVGAVHPEGTGDAHLQVHPDWRHLEEEMVEWAETFLPEPRSDESGVSPRRELRTFVFEDDEFRAGLLERRGWTRTSSGAVVRRQLLGHDVPTGDGITRGYTLRTTDGGAGDGQLIADLLNAAFRRDTHTAAEHVVFGEHAESFRRDTDLVVEGPGGTLVCYVGAPYDEANRRGILEPVCTHPQNQRLGLARELVLEAMRRLRHLGAIEVTVGTGDSEAVNRFYESLGFAEARRGAVWLLGVS